MTTFGELKCEVCGVPGSETPMFRNGPRGKGCDPHWRCEGCSSEPIDPDVLKVTDWFEVDNMRIEAERDV